MLGKSVLRQLCFTLILSSAKCALSDVTSDVFQINSGIIAAFGDLNADKVTDLFVLSPDGKSLFVFEADIDIRHDGTKFASRSFIQGKASDSVIVNVVPGDFNRDSQMDVLVMRKTGTDNSVKVEIYLWNGKNGTLYLTLNETFIDQPIVIEYVDEAFQRHRFRLKVTCISNNCRNGRTGYDGDMSPDLFGETKSGQRTVLSFQCNGSCTGHVLHKEENVPLKIPQSSAFLDLDGDLTADLCVVSLSEVDKRVMFEFWLNIDGNLTPIRNVSSPEHLKVVGQASFVDLDGNHEMNIVLPGCLDDACKEGAIFVWARRKNLKQRIDGSWHKLDVNFKVNKEQMMSFVRNVTTASWLSLPLVLRMGDFNLDGYPDALVVLYDVNGSPVNSSAFVMYNVECGGGGCQNFSRTLSADFSQPLQKYTPVVPSFFDLMENGVLDILLTEVQDDGRPVIRAIQQEFSGDASFLKVMVVSGSCQDNCPDGHSPYGVNQVGPTAKFESTTPMGNEQIGQASQLTQSAYFSLQLPFMLFGLGQTPNFVDELEVGIPYPSGQYPRRHSWSTLIPNSQVIVIPYPVGNPDRWKLKLYVTPSRLVLLTGASLLGTCAFMAIIVGLLHWRERMEDKKEKLQEAQRFHFDAM